MTDPVYTVKWTETALKLAEAIPDRRVKLLISRRVDQLASSSEQQGKALVGELAGLRSLRAVGQRFRIVYRVEQKEIVVMIVADGRRKEGDKKDIYALAKKLLRLGLLRGT
jgi:mRNA interferase RelE/StbE